MGQDFPTAQPMKKRRFKKGHKQQKTESKSKSKVNH